MYLQALLRPIAVCSVITTTAAGCGGAPADHATGSAGGAPAGLSDAGQPTHGSGGATGSSGSGGAAGARGAAGADAGGALDGLGGAGSGGEPGAAGGSAGTSSSLRIVTAWPNGVILTGVRDFISPVLSQAVQVHNSGTAPVSVTALTIGGSRPAAFQVAATTPLPLVLAGGADVTVTIEALTTMAVLPPAPPQNSGATLVTSTLTVSAGVLSAQANLFGLVLTTETHEPTLGQILTTLGYKLNVGAAQDNANPISPSDASKLPGIESNSDEVAAPLFVKAASGNVTLLPVARFSPKGPMPFGWYPKGSPSTRNAVGTMASIPDAQTSNKARMVLSPITGGQSFDPAAAAFGIWVYTDQLSQRFDTGGTATNGDYAYSEDAPNSPPNTHRSKVYPLKDGAGIALSNQYLIAIEEAGNGDYQDYVFVLGNAKVAP